MTQSEITGTPVHSTKYQEIGFQLVEAWNVGLHDEKGFARRSHSVRFWRFVDRATGDHVGPEYPTRETLVADLERYAALFGCEGAESACALCGRAA